MPSVLFEAGVIVNPAEEARLRDPAVQARIARAVAEGTKQCLN
jgi:N-acetylmuramoyl-L-alanine amidase